MRSSIRGCAAADMPRTILWAMLAGVVTISGIWYAQAQLNYRHLTQVARSLTVLVTDAALEETPEMVRVRFTLVLKNSSDRAIPIDGVSCLLYAERFFLGPCVIPGELGEAAPAGGEWHVTVSTEITGHYRENYARAQSPHVRVSGSVQLGLPVGEDVVKVTRRFSELIPKK